MTADANGESCSRSRRKVRAAARATLAFAVAFVLSVAGTEALVGAVGRAVGRAAHVAGDPVRRAEAEQAFALSSTGLMACGCLEGVVLLAVALAAARLDRSDPASPSRLRLRPSETPLRAHLAAALGLIGLTFAFGALTGLAGVGAEGVLDVIASALRAPGVGRFVLGFVSLAVVPALGEEALFRGYVQPTLGAAFGRGPAIVATAAAFGVLHRDPVQGAGAFVAGIFLGWTVERTRSLATAVVAHAANNATFIALAAVGAAGVLPRPTEVVALAAGVVTLALATWTLRASTRAS